MATPTSAEAPKAAHHSFQGFWVGGQGTTRLCLPGGRRRGLEKITCVSVPAFIWFAVGHLVLQQEFWLPTQVLLQDTR